MLQMFVLALSLYNTWNRGVFLLCKITNLLIYSTKSDSGAADDTAEEATDDAAADDTAEEATDDAAADDAE